MASSNEITLSSIVTVVNIPKNRAPKDHINIRILQNTISGIPRKLGLRARM